MRTAAIASAVLVATSLTALALTTWYGQTAPVADKRRRDNDAQSSGGLFDSWFGWLDPFQEEVQTEYEQHPNGLTSVGPWKAGDPWPGGYECTKGQSDAFHMKPDKGCEPDCEQCQMVCIPSAFLGPFKNHGGEVGGNCFERGCLQPAGEGKRSGVTYFMFDCDKALLQEWTEKQKAASESPEVVAETNRTTCIAKCSKRDKDCLKDCETKFMMALGLSAQQAAQQQKSLQECLDECGKRDKDCQIKCEETHKEELANLTIARHKVAGVQGEHADAAQTGMAMGIAMCVVIILALLGCFFIHNRHMKDKLNKKPTKVAAKAEAKAEAGAKGEGQAPALDQEAAYQVNIQGKVIQITQGPHDELVALTEDGRVFTWDLSSASKTQTSIDGRLVKGSDRDDTRRAANGELAAARQAVSTPAPSATSPTRRPPSPTRQLSSPSKSASATPAQPRKQSISALKKSVNVIRAT